MQLLEGPKTLTLESLGMMQMDQNVAVDQEGDEDGRTFGYLSTALL